MGAARYTLGANKRLKSSQKIKHVFENGKKAFKDPIRVNYNYIDIDATDPAPWKVAFVAPKRLWKKAVDRNRKKRVLKEAFRVHQDLVPKEEGKTLHFIISYIADVELSHTDLEKRVVALLGKIK